MITEPISSNQVVSVGLLRPKGADFKGDTLNDWLKWLAEQSTSVDWANFDTKCLTDYTDTCPTCPKNQKSIVELFRDVMCKLISDQKDTNTDTLTQNVISDAALLNNWKTFTGSQVLLIKQGNLVKLSGWINTGTTNTSIYTLPVGFRPIKDARFIGYYSTSPFLCIVAINATTGSVTIDVPSYSGAIAVGNYISLDQVTFFTN